MTNTENNKCALEKGGSRLRVLGFVLIVLSTILYGSLLLVPFIPSAVGTKIALSSGLVICGELCFWIGGIILGKELITKYRKKLNPLQWFKKREQETE
ncbi:MAG: transporter suffix domain-containing protein [Firmicutes bacterium]|nr:transporter suffix domain-containing protein [Bacillota bacterium]